MFINAEIDNTTGNLPNWLCRLFRIRQLVGISIACLIFCSSHLVLAGNNELLVVFNGQQLLHQNFITQLKNNLYSLGADNIHIKVITSNNLQTDTLKRYPLTLALGNRATQIISQEKISSPVLFGLVPSSTYRDIMATTHNCRPELCSAIYIDQPLDRILTLTRLALPELRTIGVLHSRSSNTNQSILTTLATRHGMKVKLQEVADTDSLVFGLTHVLDQSDALLSLPNPDIYSRHTVQNILLTAYHYRKPVIGYSHAFVKAGALFAVYSTLPQLAQQAAETIDLFFNRNAELPKPQYPRYFSVSVNNMVAKSLGIKIDDESTLQKKLEATSHE